MKRPTMAGSRDDIMTATSIENHFIRYLDIKSQKKNNENENCVFIKTGRDAEKLFKTSRIFVV